MLLFILGLIVGVLLSNLVVLLYSRQEQVITKYLDRTSRNKEKAKFFEPISGEEQIDSIFKQE